MPSRMPAPRSAPFPSPQTLTPARPDEAAALAQACAALWLATLSLMTAFMQQPAPAHRLLLARRIARNLHTLQQQDCFCAATRHRFAALSRRWEDKAGTLAAGDAPARGATGWLRALRAAWRDTA